MELTPVELKQVEQQIIREAQMEACPEEIEALKAGKVLPKRSSILNLTPMWKDGLLRSNTTLRYSNDLTDNVKYPIILPKRHPVTQLIVKQHHKNEGHEMGVTFTLSHRRERYMVVHGRKMVKRKPFTNGAVDFAGPYLTKEVSRTKPAKRYLCLFL